MTITVNIHAAKTHLPRLVEQAAKGQEFIIAKAGKPMVLVVPIAGGADCRCAGHPYARFSGWPGHHLG